MRAFHFVPVNILALDAFAPENVSGKTSFEIRYEETTAPVDDVTICVLHDDI